MAFVVSVALGRAVQSAGIHLKALLFKGKSDTLLSVRT